MVEEEERSKAALWKKRKRRGVRLRGGRRGRGGVRLCGGRKGEEEE